ncbi:MAG: NAD(P)-dependent oxidoreductase [Fimbriimonadaceae bacterium]|nr:NAD(P)-dependent oxidoreductase [Fimbriimonadaceae bacterium]
MASVGFVGLGVMGAPMAGHLLRAGHQVTVWNRTPEKCEPLRGSGATVADNLPDLAASCSVVGLCVSRTEDVLECLNAMLPSANAGTVFIDHSTIAPEGAVTCHELSEQTGCHFLDAPITGGSMGAQNGTLTIFVGGAEQVYDSVKPVLDSYARRHERVGGAGAGQMMKMANQIAVAGALLGLCESLAFAERAGLDVALAREMLATGAAGSWAFDNYGPKLLARDWSPGFSITNQRKDLHYAHDSAQRIGARVPGSDLVNDLLGELDAEGHGEWTTAALFELLSRGKQR